MRGRKPKPSALKLIDGNPGKRPIGREPRPPASLPTCPAHLSGPAKAEWKRLARTLHRIGVLTQVDRAAFAAYCQAWGRWVDPRRVEGAFPRRGRRRAAGDTPVRFATAVAAFVD